MGAGHQHGPPAGHSAASAHRGALAVAFGLTAAFFVVELVAALATGSLALLGDAGHMATDVLGLGLALAAVTASVRRAADARNTFGLYRAEVLVALLNAVALTGVTAWVALEAVRRLSDPPDVPGLALVVVAAAGLAVNLVSLSLLRRGASSSLTLQGAALEVAADALGSVAALAAGVVVLVTGDGRADAVAALVVAALVLPRAVLLARRSLVVLLQAVPAHLPLDAVRRDLAAVPGVQEVHDLHAWTLTSGMDVLSAHLVVPVGTDTHGVLDRARTLLAQEYDLAHATLQVEPADHVGCDEVRW